MDFFAQQARARGNSRGLILLFVLAVLCIVAAIDGVVATAVTWANTPTNAHPYAQPYPLTPLLIGTSLAVLAVIAVSSLLRTAMLASGGAAVARSLGANLVAPDTHDPQQRRLRNVVEEIAIAAGVPVPQVFVLDQEPGINAFAAGYSPADAAVTVTRGALEKLARDELQGVIAHEFSHILNGDMRLNLRLMGLLFGILVVGIAGQKMLQFSGYGNSDSRRNGGAILFAALGVMVIGYVGVFFGRLIKAGVSRSREYLADASAVQFTRQTAGLAGALKKAAGLDAGTRLQNAHGEEVAHMLFGDGVGYSLLFATHPPLLSRIRQLEPQFNAGDLRQLAPAWNAPGYMPAEDESAVMSDLLPSGARLSLAPTQVVAQVGRIGQITGQDRQTGAEDYRDAVRLHRQIPTVWLASARDETRALDVLFALLFDADPVVRARQAAALTADWGAARAAGAEALTASLADLHPAQRLPLAAMLLPSLRRRPRSDLLRLIRTLMTLIQADGRIQVFEYCLARLLRDQLVGVLAPVTAQTTGNRRLEASRGEIATLFSVLAEQGSRDPAAARAAFFAGADRVLPGASPAYAPPGDYWTQDLDAALTALDQLQAAGKARLIEGLVALLSADNTVTIEEAELLRIVCGALHCPLPPLLQDSG